LEQVVLDDKLFKKKKNQDHRYRHRRSRRITVLYSTVVQDIRVSGGVGSVAAVARLAGGGGEIASGETVKRETPK
jgi:hypothetical protein